MISTKRNETLFRNILKPAADQNDEIRKPVPEPPRKDTWEAFPDETGPSWQFVNMTQEK